MDELVRYLMSMGVPPELAQTHAMRMLGRLNGPMFRGDGQGARWITERNGVTVDTPAPVFTSADGGIPTAYVGDHMLTRGPSGVIVDVTPRPRPYVNIDTRPTPKVTIGHATREGFNGRTRRTAD